MTLQIFAWLCSATVVLLAAPPSNAECDPLVTPALNNTDLQPLQGCTVLRGSLILGYADCSQPCTITDLGPLSSLRTIQGSFIIQCCNTMSEITGLLSLRQIEGTFTVRSNMRLERISPQSQFSSVGSIDISQNQNLQAVTSFTTLNTLNGYLLISRNPLLTDISGFRNLVRISGGDGSGQALSILYNIALTDLSGLRALRAIGFGAVRIEGNTQLCYAGHPAWRYGSYPLRPSQGDQGIDWRTILNSAPIWQYTWNISGVPTLLIQNNGNSELCLTVQCESSCRRGIGCWGSGNGLCGPGSCFVQGNTNSCITVTVTPPTPTDCIVSWWPPTQQPFSTIFGIFFTLIALIVLAVIVAVFICIVKYRGKCSDGNKGSFDVHLQNESQFELVSNEKRYSSPSRKSDRSSIIASPAHETERSSMFVSSTTGNGGTPQKMPRPKSEAVVVLKKETRSDSLVIENLAETVEAEVNEENERAREEQLEEIRKQEEEEEIKKAEEEEERRKVEEEKERRKVEEEKIRKEIEEKKQQEDRRIKEEEEKRKEERRKQEEESERRQRLENERRQREEEEKRLREEEQRMEEKEDSEDEGAPLWDEIEALAVSPSQVELLNVIGRGTIGNAAVEVYKAKSKSLASDATDNHVVVKQLQEDAAIEDQEVFLQPAEAMGKLKHENVLSLLGVCYESSSPLMIVMEYCSNGNLKSYLRERRAQSQQMMGDGSVMSILCDMAAGLNHLNSLEIAHNDFASRNCLLTSTNTVKVGDYGFSRETFKEDYYARKEGQMSWPVRWMAPEMILDREDKTLESMQVTLSANVWSFGIAMWEVCTFSKQPYETMGEEEIIQELKATGKCRLNTPFSNTNQLAPLYGVMSRCWKLAQDRPTMETVLQQLQKLKEKFKSPKLKLSNTLPRQKPKRPAPVVPPGKQKKLTKTVSAEPLKSKSPGEKKEPKPVKADKIQSPITEEDMDVLPPEATEDKADRVRINPLFVDTEATKELDTAREDEEALEKNEGSDDKEVPAVISDSEKSPLLAPVKDKEFYDDDLSLPPPSEEEIESEKELEIPPVKIPEERKSTDEEDDLSLLPPPEEDMESDKESESVSESSVKAFDERRMKDDDDDLSLPPPPEEDIESDEEPDSPPRSPSDERGVTDEDDLGLLPPPPLEEEEDSNDESEKITAISTPPPTEFEQDQADFPPSPPAEEFLPPPMDDKNEDTVKEKKPVFDDSWKDDDGEEENMFLENEGVGMNAFSFTPDEDHDGGWEEFDPDQLPSFANYPNEPELGEDEENPTSLLTDQEAEMIW